MLNNKPDFTVRPARATDAEELCGLLNEIICIGGTTGYEDPLSNDTFAKHFLQGKNSICCYVAEEKAGVLLGFQALGHYPGLPDGWADIATFTRTKPKVSGVGSALFPHTLRHAKEAGLLTINATIRADNSGGLAFYEKIGFKTYAITPAVPLQNGRRVDRISKQFLLT